ncbi:tetratricopeptide repeat protein [uncultured Helicobacter sp.]|uniref:tetratricopeptide repeat protein n=1 Tax=uncultured Helicobacter sp. TaxID=175537 RepID=UPI0026176F15|nr:tetratricopeptide repeat protein [uncultured Helicobacter sp.]
MRRLFATSLVVASLVVAQEPSAFNAGGTAPQKTESQILNEKLFNLSTQVRTIEESQEGLKSVFEGQLQRVQDVASKIELLRGENNAIIAEVRKHTDSNFALQNENIEKIKQSISALGALIKKTNAQMQNEISVLKEKIATLENMQTTTTSSATASNVESKVNRIADTAKNAQDVKAVGNVKKTEEQNAYLAVDALIASVENNATQIKTLELENQVLDSLNAQSIENLPMDEKAENTDKDTKQESQESQKSNKMDSNNISKDGKKIEKVEPKATKDAQSTKAKEKSSSTEDLGVEDLKKKPLANVFKEGEQFYKDKNYKKADAYLQFALKGNYKPARGNYLLGEVAFEQKRYEDAIYYYKTSATRYDKADYMPRLMLHSAKSFIALKEEENAKRFLETLIALYPKTSEAREAKKLIK